MINNQQSIDQRLQQEEKEAEWEERHQHYEEQWEDRRLQFQMHQDNMQHQQQFMTTMLLMMHGIRHIRAPIPNILPMTLGGYTFPVNNQQEEEEKHGEEENTEEAEKKTDGNCYLWSQMVLQSQMFTTTLVMFNQF